MGPSDFITVHKLLLHDRLSIYNSELCIAKYLTVVSLFVDAYMIYNLSQNERHLRNTFKFLEKISIKVSE